MVKKVNLDQREEASEDERPQDKNGNEETPKPHPQNDARR